MSNDRDRLPTDRELILRLKASSEDSFVERKTFGDWKGDALKTLVAFANSTPVGYPAILFIGVKDDGTPQDTTTDNLDKLQKTLTDLAANIYPPLYHFCRVFNVDGKDVLAVVVPGSTARPHFAGSSYVRSGSKTIVASETQFNELIAQRLSVPREIMKWKGKKVTISRPQLIMAGIIRYYTQERVVEECNAFYATVSWPPGSGSSGSESFPVTGLQIGYDHGANRLKIHITDESLATQ